MYEILQLHTQNVICWIMQPKISCFIGGGSCNFQPSFRGGSLSFVPHGRGGSCGGHFQMLRPTPLPLPVLFDQSLRVKT